MRRTSSLSCCWVRKIPSKRVRVESYKFVLSTAPRHTGKCTKYPSIKTLIFPSMTIKCFTIFQSRSTNSMLFRNVDWWIFDLVLRQLNSWQRTLILLSHSVIYQRCLHTDIILIDVKVVLLVCFFVLVNDDTFNWYLLERHHDWCVMSLLLFLAAFLRPSADRCLSVTGSRFVTRKASYPAVAGAVRMGTWKCPQFSSRPPEKKVSHQLLPWLYSYFQLGCCSFHSSKKCMSFKRKLIFIPIKHSANRNKLLNSIYSAFLKKTIAMLVGLIEKIVPNFSTSNHLIYILHCGT